MTRMPPHARCQVPAPLPIGPALRRGWRLTVFEAAGASIRLGARSPGMDALLAARRVRAGTIIGAWNPLGRRVAAARNDAAHRRLRALAGPGAIEAWGRAARPPWAERHLLVPGDWRRAGVLAHRFGQHAILCLRLRAPCFLRVLR